EQLSELLSHSRVVAPEREGAVAGEEVEEGVARGVDQVWTRAADPGAVEADRAQDADELRVHVALVQQGLLAAALGEDLRHVKARHAGRGYRLAEAALVVAAGA